MPSYPELRDHFLSINPEIWQRYQDGNPVHVLGSVRPTLEVESFEPFSYRGYTLLHRSPVLSGRLAVRQLITMPATMETAHILAGIEKGNSNSGYAVMITLDAFNNIANEVGRPDIQARQA